ncbi:MAG: transcription termination/antitermination protein NusA, partial [Clostridia bacterium]|nr:transcription termination/antitermination protein NusA [Clostridia bacterium]
ELFELEVPEIEDGIVEIKSIAREAGYRTEIAVWSNDPDVDSIGACVGPRGSRIQTIVNELKNEKIDIVRYSDDPVEYIVNALSPARILSVDILAETDEAKEALVVVPNDQLSLAIGREGQNVRLAHKLTGWKIDIKSEAQMEAIEQDLYKESLENGELDGDDTEDEISQEIEEEMNEAYVVDEAEIENNGEMDEVDEDAELEDNEI